MKKLLIIIFLYSIGIIYNQELPKTEWQPYYFQGINIWSFDSANWDTDIFYIYDDDELTIEDFSFFREKSGQFNYITFSYQQNYHFYIWCPNLNIYKNYYDIFYRDFGKPFEADSVRAINKWYVDGYRTLTLSGGAIYGPCRGDMGEDLEIIFDWGSYINPEIQKLFEDSFPLVKKQEEDKRLK